MFICEPVDALCLVFFYYGVENRESRQLYLEHQPFRGFWPTRAVVALCGLGSINMGLAGFFLTLAELHILLFILRVQIKLFRSLPFSVCHSHTGKWLHGIQSIC